MKKLLLFILFLVGLGWAISNFSGLAAQGTYNTILIDFREDIGAAQIEAQIDQITQSWKLTPHLNSEFSLADHLFVLKGDQATLQSLQKSDLKRYVEAIEPNYIYRTTAAPNDPDYGKQWNMRSINVETAWDSNKGKGATVAVIDTGVSAVPDLDPVHLVEGYDFINDRREAQDDNGHGTHVAGTIGQWTNNQLGVSGIAYEANIMPLKVLSAEGGGTVGDIAEAIRFAADYGADVINMSLGGGGESQVMQEAIDYAHSKGVVVVAAAGNADRNAAEYPARYRHVIAVSALDASGNKAPYSNYGAGIDISAPGGLTSGTDGAGGILQNTIDPRTGASVFRSFQGTSMASPHVAGVAALIKSAGVKDPDEVESVLKQSALPVSDDALNHFGAGKLDAAAAVQLAMKGKISFQDFFRWLRDNGYLNPRFWIDGGVIALWPKIMMVLGSYILAWFLKNYFPFRWSWSLTTGIIAGSCGLFIMKGVYLFDAPQWPFRVLGSSLPELGNAVQGGPLNPLTASFLLPTFLVLLLLGHRQLKWFAIGTSLGMASFLAVTAVNPHSLMWLGHSWLAQGFLAVNALLCFLLARIAAKPGVTSL